MQQAVGQLRGMIGCGELKPGDVASQGLIIQMTGVSKRQAPQVIGVLIRDGC